MLRQRKEQEMRLNQVINDLCFARDWRPQHLSKFFRFELKSKRNSSKITFHYHSPVPELYVARVNYIVVEGRQEKRLSLSSPHWV